MNKDISEIKSVRRKLGLTQSQLAKNSGVSQSIIAKIESGRIDPGYSKVQKIFDVLESSLSNNSLKAKDIMQKKIIRIKISDSVEKVARVLKENAISQLPVFDKERLVGIITESGLLETLTSKKHNLHEILEDVPPIISGNAPFSSVVLLLKNHPAVFVSEKGILKGIITKSDLFIEIY